MDDFEALRRNLSLDSSRRLLLGGQEMILLPRHFFRDILAGVANVAGAGAFSQIFGDAGYQGAQKFCRKFRDHHKCTAVEAVEGYFAEMSVRGWGHFGIETIDPEGETLLAINLTHSAIAGLSDQVEPHLIWEQAAVGSAEFLFEKSGTPAPSLESSRSENDSGCRLVVTRAA